MERVFRVVRRVGCRVDDTRPLAVDRRGARKLTVEVTVDVDFIVTAVMMLVSLPSSSDSGGGEGITFRLRLGDDWTGLETGTADADRRVPAVEVRVDLTIVAGVVVELMAWVDMLIRVLELTVCLHFRVVRPKKLAIFATLPETVDSDSMTGSTLEN